jgi:hypothetical protein
MPLVDRFAEAAVEASPPPVEAEARLEWSFAEGTAPAGAGEEGDPLLGWRAFHDVEKLGVVDGRRIRSWLKGLI